MKATRVNHKFALWIVFSLLCCIVLMNLLFDSRDAMAASKGGEIKIAVVYPLSGALSRNGNLMVQGIKAAMGWVNDNGGIKSLGGAKLVPVIGDCGSSVEGAASTMERVLRDREIVMAMGSWASSYTLAATEITERLGIPQFSISFIDKLHERGFKWGFYVSPPSSRYGDLWMTDLFKMAKDAGITPKTAMIVGDNQAASRGFYEAAKKFFQGRGVKVIGEETWAMGTLTDATPVMQKVKSLNPDLVAFAPTAIGEFQICVMKRKEMDIKIPFMSAGYAADPSFRKIGSQHLEGLIVHTPSFPHRLYQPDWVKRTLDQCKKEYSDEAWIGQELSFGWLMVPVMAEILERAKSTKAIDIRKVAHEIDLQNIPATSATVNQGMAFDERGRVVEKYQGHVILKYIDGIPRVVYPPNLATHKASWVGK